MSNIIWIKSKPYEKLLSITGTCQGCSLLDDVKRCYEAPTCNFIGGAQYIFKEIEDEDSKSFL